MVEETKRPLRRRRFGCILERKGSTGDVTSIEARYISPINGQRVSKRFAPDGGAMPRIGSRPRGRSSICTVVG